MSNVQTVVADAVKPLFTLSAEMAERVAVAAEMAQDAQFDLRKAYDIIADVFRAMKSDGLLTFASWEVVRVKFEAVAATRARDNGAVDPEGAGRDCWGRATKFLAEYHSLTKPKAENPDAKRMAEKREADKAKALAQAEGKSLVDLESAKRELYAQATDESIAKAKALEKVIKVVAKAEKDAVSDQMKPLIAGADDAHKKIMAFLKTKNDPKTLGDYVVLLNRTLAIWEGKE